MKPIPEADLLAALRWRYAVKKFDPTRPVPEAQWRALIEATVLAPSSFGMQPWRFVVVEDRKVREALVAHSWGQRQVVDASHVVVFAQRVGIAAADVDRYVQRIAEVRKVPPATLDGYKKVMLGFVGQPKEKFDVDAWCGRQLYIALGFFMAAGAQLGIDTCPMEGIDPAKYDELLGLTGSGYRTVCACPIGYRAADDKYATTPKVRFTTEELVKVV